MGNKRPIPVLKACSRASDKPNGFTFIEVIVALLIMSILIAGLIEVIRLSLIYRTRIEKDAAEIQSAVRINAALRQNLAGTNIANTEVTANQISIYTRPIKRITLKSTNIGNTPSTLLEISSQSKGVSNIIASTKLNGVSAYFAKGESALNGGQMIAIYDGSKPSNSRVGDNLIALLPIYATAERPCFFDNITSQCRNLNE